ncbi:MAG TPA: hypothetical protein VGH31_11920 [Acidimicrobiales bacterium]
MITLRRFDSPLTNFVIAAVAATGFVMARWHDAARHRLGDFVVAGAKYVHRTPANRAIPIRSGSGYDGQFYYRLALSPFDLSRNGFGVHLDSFSRVERMGYPFLAWVVSLGQHANLPLALVVVNVIACSVVALAGGLVARSAGRHALWGLAFAGYWGYLWTLGRDLTELTAAAFLMLGFAALLRHAPGWAALAFLGAVVSKETTVLLVGVLALSTLYRRRQGRPTLLATPRTSADGTARPESWTRLRPRYADMAYLVPLAGFVAWEAVLFAATGKLPIYKSGGENLGLPFLGIYRGFTHYIRLVPSTASAIWFGELSVLGLLVLGAFLALRQAPFEFRVVWVFSVLLALSTTTGIWLGDVGFRSLDDTYLMSWVILLFRPARQSFGLKPWVVLCVGTWIGVSVELVRFI